MTHNNQLYEVVYSIGARETSGTFIGTPGLQYLRTTIQATSNTNAQRIVEAMFGGYNSVQVGPGILVG